MKHSNTNWNLYRNFIVAYETRNFHHAADILGITRSGVGHNIRELEKQMDTRLFTPTKKGVEPTSDAVMIYPSIKLAVDSIIGAEESVLAFDNSSCAIIRIAVASSYISSYLGKYIFEFCQKFPRVSFQFYDRNSFELLNEHKIDFTIRIDTFMVNSKYKIIKLFNDNLVCITSKNFLERNNLTIGSASNQIPSLPTIASQNVVKIMKQQFGYEGMPMFLTSTSEPAFALVENALGIGYVFEHRLDKYQISNIVKLNDPTLTSKVSVCCEYDPKHITKAAKTFVDGLSEYCKSHHLLH
jgi:DNA-binding transcriptional LysR family regulator